MQDHIYDALDALRQAQQAHQRHVGGRILEAMALSLYAAGAVLFFLATVLWAQSSDVPESRDFPGRYLLGVLPVVAAGITLHVAGWRMRLRD